MDRLRSLTKHLQPSTPEEYDVIIIGGGIIGISAAYWLTKLQPHLRVALVEKHSVGHVASSSFGDSRMYRCMYDKEYYARMQEAALVLWQGLEQECGQRLISRHGLLFYGDTDTGETVEGSLPSVKAVLHTLAIPHEVVGSAAGLNRRWPVQATPGQEGIWEPGAGSIHARRACSALRDGAVSAGLELYDNEAVTLLTRPAPGQVRVETSRGRTLTSRRAIVAVGAWTNPILRSLGVELDVEIWKMHWGHYYVDPRLAARYPQWYHFGKPQAGTLDEGLYYGFPPEGPDPVIKVGVDFAPANPKFRARSARDLTWRPDPNILAALHRFLTTKWKGFLSLKNATCSPYTMTSDGMFILDRLPQCPEVAVFSGGCGRAFKFGILLGRCLADLTMDSPTVFDTGPLQIGQRMREVLAGN